MTGTKYGYTPVNLFIFGRPGGLSLQSFCPAEKAGAKRIYAAIPGARPLLISNLKVQTETTLLILIWPYMVLFFL
jgi:hypothetical protein